LKTRRKLKPDDLQHGAQEKYAANEEDGINNPGNAPFEIGSMDVHTIKAFCIHRSAGSRVTSWVALCCLMLIGGDGLAQKSLRLEDAVYEPEIRTVLCYALSPGIGVPASTARLEAQNLVLEFDDLRDQKVNYYLRIVHCNFDWTRSQLRDLDIMKEYNEFPINDFEYSLSTYVSYVHYRIAVPSVKLPGNYLLIVYRDGDKEDIVLTRRILIFQNLTTLTQEGNLAGLGNLQSTNQALNFRVSYDRIEVLNPASTVHVVIRQNQRWDNARKDVRPSLIREDIRQLEYRFFDMDHSFAAGNEFRFVDFRSINSPGINTARIDRTNRPPDLYLTQDATRNGLAYTQLPDRNGSFVIENFDNRSQPWVSCNYLYVNFILRSPKLPSDVYVIGAFNNWARNEENRMTWADGKYSGRLLLKQGFYDYQYWVPSSSTLDSNELEGNHFQTENVYEVLIYYRPFQPNVDLLVGYFPIPVNAR